MGDFADDWMPDDLGTRVHGPRPAQVKCPKCGKLHRFMQPRKDKRCFRCSTNRKDN